MGNNSQLPTKLLTLHFVTANVTSWTSCREWLKNTPKDPLPHVLMLQEHKLCQARELDEASTFGASLGYTSLWTPAAKGPGGKTAGGTAILAIQQLGLIKPQLPKGLKTHPRLTMGVIEPSTVGKLAIFSAYGKTQLGANDPVAEVEAYGEA